MKAKDIQGGVNDQTVSQPAAETSADDPSGHPPAGGVDDSPMCGRPAHFPDMEPYEVEAHNEATYLAEAVLGGADKMNANY